MRIFECRPTKQAGGVEKIHEFSLRIIITIIMFVIIGLTSCRSPDISKTTHIRDTTYTIIPPVIIDSGRAEMQLRITNDELRKNLDSMFIPASQDTIYQYAKIRAGDTVIKFEFVPRTRWVYYKIKPDTIFYTARDTLTEYKTKEKIIETPWMAKVGIFCYGIVAAIILAMIIYAINWYRYGRVKPVTIEAKSDDGLP